MPTSVYQLLREMDAESIIVAYNGPIDDKLLDAVYSMIDKHMDERKSSADKRKKLFQVLIEALQNVFRHNPDDKSVAAHKTGFVIKCTDEIYTIITGNLISTEALPGLKEKIEKVNSLNPADLRTHYQESLAKADYSEKGGAGLGIIEMARKSGNKLKYEFTSVNDNYSFFTLEITI